MDEKEAGESSQSTTPTAFQINRPVRELRIEKGNGTALKVQYKLSRKKNEEILKMLHVILFGRRGKETHVRSNVSRFSGFVWHENEEKQRLKIKERLNKCVKEKLLEFCDVLDIGVVKTTIKSIKKSGTTKKRSVETSMQESGRSAAKRSSVKQRKTEGSSNVVEKESESESDDEFEKEEAEERLNSDPDGSDDEGAEHSESDVKGSESGEDSEEETRNHNSGLKGSSAKTTSSAKDKSKKVTTEKKETLVKSPKKVPMTNNSKANDSIGESPVVFSRRKKSEETTNKKSFAPSKCSSKENDSMEKSGKKSVKGKDKVKEACAPTDEELRKVIYKILSRSDLKTGNGTALKDIPKVIIVSGTMDIPLPLDRLSFPSPSSDATTLDAVNRDQTCVVLLATGSFNPPTYMHLRLFVLVARFSFLSLCCHNMPRLARAPEPSGFAAKQSNYQRTLTVLARISSSVCESKSIPRESLRVMLVCGSDLLESFSIPGVWIREQVRAICRDYGVVCIRREGKDIERVISADDILNEYKNNIKVVNLTGAKSDKFNKSKGMHFEKAVN
ncbi:hypothetical protein IFM89_022656 [Coptis chinensis]|uniref:Cytidyltransferase-like domain-containing protein n=1 Tax=Coptis chinensis TaxID=261450 RepID=A0A835LEX2_9MAGN|nr:hypothetical protein IFM89_022656 [Coptis chinensis]